MLVESKWSALSEWQCDEVVAEIGLGSGDMGGLLQLQPSHFVDTFDMGITKQHGAGAVRGRCVFVHDRDVDESIWPFAFLVGKRRIRLVGSAGPGLHESLFTSTGKITRERCLHALRIRQVWKFVVVIVGVHRPSETDFFEIGPRTAIYRAGSRRAC